MFFSQVFILKISEQTGKLNKRHSVHQSAHFLDQTSFHRPVAAQQTMTRITARVYYCSQLCGLTRRSLCFAQCWLGHRQCFPWLGVQSCLLGARILSMWLCSKKKQTKKQRRNHEDMLQSGRGTLVATPLPFVSEASPGPRGTETDTTS